MKVLKRALSDTFSGQFVALAVLVVGGFLSLAYLFVIESPTVAAEEIPYVSGAIFGAFGALLLLFLWNLACAPYRIERDAYESCKDEMSRITGLKSGQSMAEFWDSRGYFTVKEVSCLLAGVPISNGEIVGIAGGHLYDICKKISQGEIMPHSLSKMQKQNLEMSRKFAVLDQVGGSPAWLQGCEVSKDQAISLGVKVEGHSLQSPPKNELETPR